MYRKYLVNNNHHCHPETMLSTIGINIYNMSQVATCEADWLGCESLLFLHVLLIPSEILSEG